MVNDLTCGYAIFALLISKWLCFGWSIIERAWFALETAFKLVNLLILYTETTLHPPLSWNFFFLLSSLCLSIPHFSFSLIMLSSFFLFIYPHLHSSIFFNKLLNDAKQKERWNGWNVKASHFIQLDHIW